MHRHKNRLINAKYTWRSLVLIYFSKKFTLILQESTQSLPVAFFSPKLVMLLKGYNIGCICIWFVSILSLRSLVADIASSLIDNYQLIIYSSACPLICPSGMKSISWLFTFLPVHSSVHPEWDHQLIIYSSACSLICPSGMRLKHCC